MTGREKPLDVLLIHPGNRARIYQGLGRDLAAVEPPVWAGLLATFLRIRGLGVAVIDADAMGLTPQMVADQVEAHSPVLVCPVVYGHNPSASTMVMPGAGAVCREIKARNPRRPILLVGGHVAALPARTLAEEAADYVCAGEGPYTIFDLVRCLKNGGEGIHRVRGLVRREGKGVVFNRPAPLVIDLDHEMPSVAWDLLPMDRYRAHNWHCFDHLDCRQPYGALYTTLGCPFHCHFCCIQAPFRQGETALGYKAGVNSYRRWRPETVMGQIETLAAGYGVRNIKLADELFVMNRGHVSAICDMIIERGYDLNIWAYARVDSWRPDLLAKMARAGIRWLALGIESASDRVRDDMQKGFNPGRLTETASAMADHGIHVLGNYLFGLPEDDRETMAQTLALAQDLNFPFANFNCAMAYPGSGLYEMARREGMALPGSWDGFAQHGRDTLPLATRHLTGAQVLAFRDHAFTTYFTSDTYLAAVTETFGSAAADHVRKMTACKLERNPNPQVTHGV